MLSRVVAGATRAGSRASSTNATAAINSMKELPTPPSFTFLRNLGKLGGECKSRDDANERRTKNIARFLL